MNRRNFIAALVATGALPHNHAPKFLSPPFPLGGQRPVSQTTADRPGGFRIYDALGGKDKPDLSRYGLLPFKLAYTSELWPDAERERPDLPYIRQNYIRTKLSTLPIRVHAIDIEHWPTRVSKYGATAVADSVAKLKTVLALFRCSAPSMMHGYYGIIPAREYWAPVRRDTAAIALWEADNLALSPIAELADVIFPSLYTFYDDLPNWKVYAAANIAEASKYRKPILPFLWPRYHSGPKGGQLVPGELWRQQLEFALGLTDGVILWDWSRAIWDEEAPWWRETLDLLR